MPGRGAWRRGNSHIPSNVLSVHQGGAKNDSFNDSKATKEGEIGLFQDIRQVFKEIFGTKMIFNALAVSNFDIMLQTQL